MEAKAIAESLPGATFYRLRPNDAHGEPITDPGAFVKTPDLFIDSIEQGASALFLYGRDEEGQFPSYYDFLRQFEKFDLHPSRKYAYVIIIHHVPDPPCWYAIAFGLGRYLLRDELISVEAHRDVARHETIPREPGRPARLKHVRTKRPGTSIVTTERRTGLPGSLADLEVDVYTEVIDEVFGEPGDKARFGSALAGGSGLGIRKRLTLTSILETASAFESSYREVEQQQDAPVMGMRTVRSSSLVGRLDQKLVEMFKGARGDDIGFALPYFPDIEDAPIVRFTKLGTRQDYPDDTSLTQYRALVRAAGKFDDVDVEFLKSAEVRVGEAGKRFSVYECLPATVILDGRRYVHDERLWYEIPADLLQSINEQIDGISFWDGGLRTALDLRLREAAYNELVGVGDVLNLDKRTRAIFAGESPIEICDLLTFESDRLTFVHVKRDFSSSTLSHLFNQGRVSALMLQQVQARPLLLEQINLIMRSRGGRYPAWANRARRILGTRFTPSSVRVVYAIMGEWGDRPASEALPFFSKVMLLRAAQELRGREFDVRLMRVQMDNR